MKSNLAYLTRGPTYNEASAKETGVPIQDIVIKIMNEYGYLGIIFLIFIENIFPPIPSEVILTFGGFLTTCTVMNVPGVVVFATVGSVMGAFLLYYLGYFLSPSRQEQLINGKAGKFLHLKMESFQKGQSWFEKHGNTTVFFCRFIPIIRSVISVPAGMAGMDIGKFTILTTLGSFGWNLVLVSLGAWAGKSWEKIADYMKEYALVGKGILIAVVVIWFWRFIKRKKKTVCGK